MASISLVLVGPENVFSSEIRGKINKMIKLDTYVTLAILRII